MNDHECQIHDKIIICLFENNLKEAICFWSNEACFNMKKVRNNAIQGIPKGHFSTVMVINNN